MEQGFYMTGTSVMKELKLSTPAGKLCNMQTKFHTTVTIAIGKTCVCMCVYCFLKF